jgi:hypothetical protein
MTTILTIERVGLPAMQRAADSMASGPTGLKIVSESKQKSQPRTRILAIIRRDRLAEI